MDWQRVEKDMKKAKEQLKIRKSNQIPTEVKSKAEEVRLHFVSVQPKGVVNFACTKMEKTYQYVSLGWNIFTSEAFSKGKPTRTSRRFGDFYWGCRHTCGLIIPWTSSCQEVRKLRMYVLQLLWSFWWASLVVQMVKHLPAMQETRVWSLGWEDPLEKEMATHFSTFAWKIPWTGAW